jgi:uncharacterized membrane protein YgaE (UPF0421/DUF939 family)
MRTGLELSSRWTRLHEASPLLRRIAAGARGGIIAAVAAVAAYLPVEFLQLKQGIWAAIAAIAAVQSEFQSTRSTARDQCLGAAVGGVAGLFGFHLPFEHLSMYAATVLTSMVICSALNVTSASRLSAITATIVFLVPHTDQSAWNAVLSRVSMVGWGVGVAVATVWLAARLRLRSKQPAADP